MTLIAFMRFAHPGSMSIAGAIANSAYSRTATLGGSQGMGLAPRLRGGSAPYSLRSAFSEVQHERRRSHNPANSCSCGYGGGEGERQQAVAYKHSSDHHLGLLRAAAIEPMDESRFF